NPSEQGKTSGAGMPARSYAMSSVSSVPVDMAGIEWQKMLGGSMGEGFIDIQPTFDGNYIAAGATGSWDMMDDNGIVVPGYVSYTEAWIAKIDPSGKTLWQKLFGAWGYDQAMSIRNTADEGYVFAGFTNSTDSEFANLNHGKEDGWVVKLDSAGNKIWQTLLGGSGNERLMSVRQTSDKGYIVAGYTESNDIQNAGTYHGNTDIYVAKLNSAGGIVWQKVIGGSKYDFGSSIIPASDGGYILTGYTQSDDIPLANTNHGYYDILVMKLDDSGNLLWTKLIGGRGGEVTAFDNVIQPTDDGGYILTGQTTSSANGDVGTTHGSADVWVVKLDASGAIQWQNLLGGTGYDDGTAIRQTPHGDYILVGRTTSDNSGDVGQNNGGWDTWVTKLDSAGKLLWQDVLGGSRYEQCSAILPTPDEGFIFTGYTESSNSGNIGTNHGYQDAWIVKLKPRLVVDVLDSDTNGPVPNARVFLHDVAHNEDQNLTVVNGRVVFTGSGASDQFRFTNGSQYTIRATADKYRDGAPVGVVFAHDGQRVIVNLTALERPTIGKTYSITNTMYLNKKPTDASDDVLDVVQGKLRNQWGEPVFYEKGPTVSDGYFGGDSQAPSKSLNDATLHYHTGHGSFIGYDTPGNSSLGLLKSTENNGNYNYNWFNAQDIQNKWGGKNKWVVLHSCNILGDKKWGGALGKTHAIFGFSTVSDMDSNLPYYFFDDALKGETLYNSWRSATVKAFKDTNVASYYKDDDVLVKDGRVNITAVVYFKTEEQMRKDHLPEAGSGEIAPDGVQNTRAKIFAWDCGSNKDVEL
ncbi:MAG: hypothetical protein Q8R70_09630, partial [Methanoregula sp.]|nr:hypothetical protein [Methanoregula sp.]